MKISFTKKQYKDLLELVYLGNWLVNAIRTGQKDDKRIQKFEDIEKYIFSFAKEMGFTALVEYDNEYKTLFPTRELEEGLDQYIEEYDEHNFFEDLVYKLARRDFERYYGSEAVQKMDPMEVISKEHPFLEKWWAEIEEYDIARLEVDSKTNS